MNDYEKGRAMPITEPARGEPVAWKMVGKRGKMVHLVSKVCADDYDSFDITPLYANPSEDARDAERYRWLRENGRAEIYVLQTWTKGDPHSPLTLAQREQLDAAIDAAKGAGS